MSKSDVLPVFSIHDSADQRLADPILVSQGFLRKRAGSNGQHVGFGEFGRPMAFFSGGDESPVNSFCRVVSSCSEMQMVGMTANLPITVMKNIQAIGRPFEDFVGRNVRPDYSQTTVGGDGKLAVPEAGGGRPVPAAGGWRIARHEPAKGLFFGKPLGSPQSRSSQRVTVPFQPMGVKPTKTVRVARSSASRNRTSCHKQGV